MPSPKNQNSLADIWRKGVSLNDALTHLLSESAIQSRYRKVPDHYDPIGEIGRTNFRRAGMNADKLVDAVDSGMKALSHNATMRSLRQSLLIENLAIGKLIAVGIPTHNLNTTSPELIPDFLLNPKYVKWRQSEISGHGRVYAEVRVSKKSGLPAVDTDSLSSKTGRPSFKDEIFRIIEEFDGNEEFSNSKTLTETALKIYSYGKEKFPERFKDDVPSTETIIRHYKAYSNRKNS